MDYYSRTEIEITPKAPLWLRAVYGAGLLALAFGLGFALMAAALLL